MEDLKDFHDTHDSLLNWLLAKEKMMTVLGPISSDSRMVQNQVQQVQVKTILSIVLHLYEFQFNQYSFERQKIV